MRIERIKGVVKNYAWGNCDYIPSLVGGYDGMPQAELWFGAHPSGPSVLEGGKTLEDAVRSDRSLLGPSYDKWQGRFPILFKVLAIAKPLSLQCHPDKAQAEEGWAREARLRSEGKPCNYQDDNQKAEIFAALTPVTAMCGFRDLDDVRVDLSRLLPVSYAQYLEPVMGTVKELFMGIYALSGKARAEVLSELAASFASSDEPDWEGPFLTRKGVAKECLGMYRGDIGAIFPYVLNVLHLDPGEAVYLMPDILHAYAYGNGVELMDASDNVLRGGLTEKRIDLEELERIMLFEATEGKKVAVKDVDGLTGYPTEGTSFLLLSCSAGHYRLSSSALRLCLAIDGNVTFTVDDSQVALGKGECALIPAELGEYAMDVTGTAYFAEVVS